MATKFEFYLSDEDTDRLFFSKEEAGENELTGNEYAKQLLHSALYRLCPRVPETDEDGNGNYIKGAKK